MKIKFCGFTNIDNAKDAINLGVDAIGFNFYPQSPRYIKPEVLEELVPFLSPFVQLVGVFVNQPVDEMNDIAHRCRLDIVQCHGDESPTDCLKVEKRVIKAFRLKDKEDLKPIQDYKGCVSSILLDTKTHSQYGGSGQTFDWGLAIAAKAFEMPLILSGGLCAKNLEKAMRLVNPFAIDLCSSIETEPGIKDYHLMKEILQLSLLN